MHWQPGEFWGGGKTIALAVTDLGYREGLNPCQLLQPVVPVASPLLHYWCLLCRTCWAWNWFSAGLPSAIGQIEEEIPCSELHTFISALVSVGDACQEKTHAERFCLLGNIHDCKHRFLWFLSLLVAFRSLSSCFTPCMKWKEFISGKGPPSVGLCRGAWVEVISDGIQLRWTLLTIWSERYFYHAGAHRTWDFIYLKVPKYPRLASARLLERNFQHTDVWKQSKYHKANMMVAALELNPTLHAYSMNSIFSTGKTPVFYVTFYITDLIAAWLTALAI